MSCSHRTRLHRETLSRLVRAFHHSSAKQVINWGFVGLLASKPVLLALIMGLACCAEALCSCHVYDIPLAALVACHNVMCSPACAVKGAPTYASGG
jgi:hypothetical protein